MRRRSLRARLLAIGGGGALVTVVALAAVAAMASRLQRELTAATVEVLEEQQIADRISTGVMRQLATLAAAGGIGDSTVRAGFDAAGAVVSEGVRSYLFRPLSIDERLALERVNEEHRQMEVAAVRAAQAAENGGVLARSDLQAQALGHALGLLDAMDAFLRQRQANFDALLVAQREQIARLWWLGGGILVTSAFAIAWLLPRFARRRITAPLAMLGEASRRLGEGALGVRVHEEHDDEFRALAQSFNRMSEQLATMQADLEGRNQALETALEEVHRAQADLLEAEKLGALGRMTAGLAHELNNPLASVLGASTLLETELREGRALPPHEMLERFVTPIVREATRARLLVRSLLQFSRRAGGAVEPVSLRDAVENVRELRQHAFAQAGLRLEIAPLPEVAVLAEPQQLQAIILNLVNNAEHALQGQAGGRLAIRALVDEGVVALRFEDDGPGVPALDRVFEPFYTTKPVGEGTGLGLALSRRFAEAFGGTLRVDNRPEGGACFTLVLRVADAAPAPRPAADDVMPSNALDGRSVLVVDDEPELRALAARALARLGVTVHVADGVASALAILERTRVDVVVSDVRMPGESGLDLHRWVLAHRPALAEHFLFVTGDVSDPALAALAAERPEAVILKPFELREYLGRVERMLGGAVNGER
ncbi:MAG TPA: ATP-binding protein [Gemmatimonadales bacterium]|nr:ATP-binding protein [Gemmatimonadales bacterium]